MAESADAVEMEDAQDAARADDHYGWMWHNKLKGM